MKTKTFKFNGNRYKYFEHEYNKTYSNERVIEVPIIWKIVEENKDKKILEVGNVLSHYFNVSHDIVDLEEKYENVINKDIRKYKPNKLYDLIVSISTLEHIEGNKKETKELFNNLLKLLTPGGKLIVTLPLGTNLMLDKFLKNGDISFQNMYCFERVSVVNDWKERYWEDIKKEDFSHFTHFGAKYVSVPFMLIGMHSKGKVRFVIIGITEGGKNGRI